ncbi:hypothetical protein D477_009720 [Arthrobacter crystallopoietes BAB-32]|uniref:DUF3040 domain-containing protein n=1 Tax=Arthrobacter crystallopoietes BAB-32 TaxID=1246476 RepID=N1UZD1_9MICC|nr:DUF3040 domain-containing protein [Arthrobacter crystallopoietes]EMY34420.1 hypothetical protein D477_009720 [Arthrobacter crystallopoietes BAB-32]
MPLSEEERKRLEELEQALSADDPGLAHKLGSARGGRVPGRIAVTSILISVAGLALIIVGIATQITIIGVLGFLVMGAGAYRLVGNRLFRGTGKKRINNDGGASP